MATPLIQQLRINSHINLQEIFALVCFGFSRSARHGQGFVTFVLCLNTLEGTIYMGFPTANKVFLASISFNSRKSKNNHMAFPF